MITTAKAALSNSRKRARTMQKWAIGIALLTIIISAVVLQNQRKILSKAYVLHSIQDDRRTIKNQMQSAEINKLKARIFLLERQIKELQSGRKVDGYRFVQGL